MVYESVIAQEIKRLTESGITLIPVGEKDKVPKGGVKWGSLVSPLPLLRLFDLMSENETNAVAAICGLPSKGISSDGLIIIDFDVKNKRELGDGEFLKLFKDRFIELLDSVRIESSPSGGNHILYQITGLPKDIEFPKGSKIASRESTDQELIANPKEKTKCFIEIKGGGGYMCQIYPSPGYTLISGDIGLVSWEDHIEVVNFLQAFNEVEKEVKFTKSVSKDEQYWYIEGKNPFDEYNLNHTGNILEEDGWALYQKGSQGKYKKYARPGSLKSSHYGACYDTSTKMYKIFTSSSNLDVRSYNPSDLLCILRYGGNKSDLHSYLVSQGYGKLKKNIELRIVKNSAKFDTPLPANISKEARESLDGERKKIKEKYPHGLFWNINEEGIVEISQKKIDSTVISLGFRNIIGEGLVLLDGYLIRKVEENRIFHYLINYILRVDGDWFSDVDEVNEVNEGFEESERKEVEDIYNAYSSFINKFGKITIEHLKEFGRIQDGKILISSKTESYKFYKNCYVSICKDGVEILEYSNLGDKLILEHLIIQRNFKLIQNPQESKPYIFFSKAIGIDNSFLTCLGYLSHDFIDDSMNAIFVGLGTPGCGKNILFNLLNHITSVHVIDGRQVELDKNLLQSYEGQRVLVISDVEQNFKYDFFKNFSSGAASLKKLYKDVVVLKRKKMPKPVILTNFSYKMVEGLERRIFDIEFTDFFSRIKGGVATYFKSMFPGYDIENKGGWDEFDWNSFDSICISAICAFLKVGEMIPRELSENSWYKRFQSTYGHLLDFFNEKIEEWLLIGKIKCSSFEEIYISWSRLHGIKNTYSPTKYNKALLEYCEYLGYEFRKDATLKDEHRFDAKFKTFAKKGIKDEDAPF